MLRSLYTAATGMDAQQLRMDVIANNLANTSTTGFKKTRAEFEDLLSVTLKGASAPSARASWRRRTTRSTWPSRGRASSACSAPRGSRRSRAPATSAWTPSAAW
jgi:flagellar hook-basal body protein